MYTLPFLEWKQMAPPIRSSEDSYQFGAYFPLAIINPEGERIPTLTPFQPPRVSTWNRVDLSFEHRTMFTGLITLHMWKYAPFPKIRPFHDLRNLAFYISQHSNPPEQPNTPNTSARILLPTAILRPSAAIFTRVVASKCNPVSRGPRSGVWLMWTWMPDTTTSNSGGQTTVYQVWT